jgi:uncharacterized protein with HEPN domain
VLLAHADRSSFQPFGSDCQGSVSRFYVRCGDDLRDIQDDNLHLYAVTRGREIISEASRRLPEALRERHPAIQWKDMAAAGNIDRYEYEDVAAGEVWDIVTLHLPPLRAVVEAELAALGDE